MFKRRYRLCYVATDLPDRLRPLSTEQMSILEVNISFLEASIESDAGLVDAAYSKKIFTQRQKEHFAQYHGSERNSVLLDILSRRSAAHFVLFIEVLRDSGQTHIARVLDEGGGKKQKFLSNI